METFSRVLLSLLRAVTGPPSGVLAPLQPSSPPISATAKIRIAADATRAPLPAQRPQSERAAEREPGSVGAGQRNDRRLHLVWLVGVAEAVMERDGHAQAGQEPGGRANEHVGRVVLIGDDPQHAA